MTFDFDARQFGRMKKGMQHSGVPEVAGPDILHDTTDRTRAPPHRPSLSENIKIIVTFQRRQMFSILLELDREAPLERCDPCLLNPVKVVQAPHRSLAIDPARPAKPLAQSIPERMIAGAQPLRQRIPWRWKGYGDRKDRSSSATRHSTSSGMLYFRKIDDESEGGNILGKRIIPCVPTLSPTDRTCEVARPTSIQSSELIG